MYIYVICETPPFCNVTTKEVVEGGREKERDGDREKPLAAIKLSYHEVILSIVRRSLFKENVYIIFLIPPTRLGATLLL